MSILQERFFWSPYFPNQGPHACKARIWPLLPLQPRLLALCLCIIRFWSSFGAFIYCFSLPRKFYSLPSAPFSGLKFGELPLGSPLNAPTLPRCLSQGPWHMASPELAPLPAPYQNGLGLCILTRLSVLWGQSMPPMLKLYLQHLAQWRMQNRCSVNACSISEWASEQPVSQASSDTSPNAWFSFANSSSLVKLPSLEQLLLFHSRQKSDADKATYISQRKRNFSKVLRISIW